MIRDSCFITRVNDEYNITLKRFNCNCFQVAINIIYQLQVMSEHQQLTISVDVSFEIFVMSLKLLFVNTYIPMVFLFFNFLFFKMNFITYRC